NTTSDVAVTNCTSFSATIAPERLQWSYNPQDGSIRSKLNGRCLSIDSCSTSEAANIVVSECQINDPSAQCQGKNQQWTINT
ncbi:unnamed protein product, partial [Rotaria magnacalcarata]